MKKRQKKRRAGSSSAWLCVAIRREGTSGLHWGPWSYSHLQRDTQRFVLELLLAKQLCILLCFFSCLQTTARQKLEKLWCGSSRQSVSGGTHARHSVGEHTISNATQILQLHDLKYSTVAQFWASPFLEIFFPSFSFPTSQYLNCTFISEGK